MNPSTTRSDTAAPPRRIFVAVDSSPASRRALAYACNLVPPDGQVHIASVAENPRTLVPLDALTAATLESARAELLQDATDAVTQAADMCAQCNIPTETQVVDLSKQSGDVVHALIHGASAWHADLLVVGARQHHGVLRWVEGTVSEPLAKLSPCPILLVPESYTVKAGRLPRRILFAIDGSEQAEKALQYGVRFATPDSHLRAIYVVDRAVRFTDPVPIQLLEDAFVKEGESALATARQILAGAPGQSTTELVSTGRASDDVSHTIVREAERWQTEMIVMGTHGRRGIVRWILGSVAGRVAQMTPVPLLLVNMQEP
jgi:nucleotide-binding universal stress UspA family protein